MVLTTGYATVTHDGYTVDSNRATEAEIRTAIGAPSVEEEKAKAAATLGKEGGKKSAEARRQRAAEDQGGESDDSGKDDKPPETKKTAPAVGAGAAAAGAADEGAKEDESKEGAESKPSKKGSPRHDPEARKAQIAGEIRELTEKRRRVAAEVERLEKQKTAPGKDDEDTEPAFEEYETKGKDVGAFLTDHEQWAVRAAVKKHETERQAKERHEAAVAETKQFIGDYEKRMNEYEDENEGFLEKLDPELTAIPPARVMPPDQRQLVNYLVEEIISSEHAPQLWAHFSEKPKEFQRLATLHPRTMLREIAKLDVTFSDPEAAATAGKPAPKVPESSKAAPPLPPVRGTPKVADLEPAADDPDYDKHFRFYNSRDARRIAASAR